MPPRQVEAHIRKAAALGGAAAAQRDKELAESRPPITQQPTQILAVGTVLGWPRLQL